MFDSPFVSYAYAYPHKSAYRKLTPTVPLGDVWAGQNTDSLFLYCHVPFCEFRCGFCNLFTLARPERELTARYLQSMRYQAERLRDAIPAARFARMAIGGGTPTYLNPSELAALFDIMRDVMGVDAATIPAGCEASPSTVDQEKLRLLRQFGIDRVSLGVQSFDEKEVHAIGRPQRSRDVERAIELIRDAGFPTLNLDLIYGALGESESKWLDSVRRAIAYRPEEIYLYPLYVRQLTGLGKVSSTHERLPDEGWDDQRLRAYRSARALLLDQGYEQVSLRMFRAMDHCEEAGPVYCCQTDAMVGLGCGARSYTDRLHYSYEYAVASKAVRSILVDYVTRDEASFAEVEHGFWLDDEDQRRRYTVMSLLQCEGLSRTDYLRRFGTSVVDDFPALEDLQSAGYLRVTDGRVVLTALGVEYSDAIGPWFNSAKVRQLEEDFQWR